MFYSQDFSHEKRSTCFTVDFKSRVDSTTSRTSTAIGSVPTTFGETIGEKDNSAKPADEQDQYDSPKEKQCLHMYRKMTAKGINVSFDTILRGMLTPTEYRLSKKKMEAIRSEAHAKEENKRDDDKS
ncbi:unnamed protein product [Acanthoscelides obtectus]|uniref:Uncharacterized protein n=1 Tax=Acanthoscelides obtectus TaxID=200917 RepID=A0A9P0JX24_ACAOB|nr:unnamed protein product [Acanthoscelides obtectus]CAK1639136.1 hypothetical protein AOBTE_LOCUS11013 [Acanthoscelides obtectus]